MKETLYLDGTTPQDLAREINTLVHVLPSDAGGLINFLQNIPELLHQLNFCSFKLFL